MNNALLLKMGVELSEFQKGLDRSVAEAAAAQEKITAAHKREVEKRKAAEKSGEGVVGGLADAGKLAAAASGIALGAEGLMEMARSALETGARIKDLSETTGVGVEQVQTLGYAFTQTGATQEEFAKGMIKLTEHIGEAKNGSEEMISKFGEWGVTWKDLQSLSPDAILLKLSDASKLAGSDAQRLTMYLDLLGKSGAHMAPGLNAGSEEIKKLQAQITALNEGQVEDLAGAKKAWASWGDQVQMSFAKATAGFLEFRKWVRSTTIEGRKQTAADNIDPAKQEPGYEESHPSAPAPEESETARHQREIREAQARYEGKSEPVFKGTREAINNGIDEELRRDTAERAHPGAANEAAGEQAAQETEKRKALLQIQNEGDYAHMSAMASIVGQTSKLLQMDQEDALIKRQIADAEAKLTNEGDDAKRATIEREITGLKDKALETDTKRAELEIKIADAEQEIRFAIQQQAIDKLKGVSIAGDQLARDKEIELIGQKIAKNLADMKNADELRTAELKKQNVELKTQQQTIEAADRAKFIKDHTGTPQDQNKAHAEDMHNESLSKAWARRQARLRGERTGNSLHGAAQPDAGHKHPFASEEDPSLGMHGHERYEPKVDHNHRGHMGPMPDRSFIPGGKRWDGSTEDPKEPGHVSHPITHMPDRAMPGNERTWDNRWRHGAPHEPGVDHGDSTGKQYGPEPFFFPGYGKPHADSGGGGKGGGVDLAGIVHSADDHRQQY